MKYIWIAVILLAMPSIVHAEGWELDKTHSSVEFTVRHMMVSDVRGQFKDFSVTLKADEKDITKSSVEATNAIAGIDTRDEKCDGHLKSPDFFDAEKYPTMTFKSKTIAKAGKGRYKMKVDLTIHSVTKEVVLDLEAPQKPVKSPWGTEVFAVQAYGKINRKDFGVNWNKVLDGGGLLVGDEVKIAINAELAKKPPEQPKADTQSGAGEKKAEEKK